MTRCAMIIFAGLSVLSGCSDLPPSFSSAPAAPQPMTLPFADGRVQEVGIGDGYAYQVSYQGLDQAQGGVYLRVTRATAPELGYSDGLVAKKAAEAFCAGYNRRLNPVSYGRFSLPSSWLFEGGCQ